MKVVGPRLESDEVCKMWGGEDIRMVVAHKADIVRVLQRCRWMFWCHRDVRKEYKLQRMQIAGDARSSRRIENRRVRFCRKVG